MDGIDVVGSHVLGRFVVGVLEGIANVGEQVGLALGCEGIAVGSWVGLPVDGIMDGILEGGIRGVLLGRL
jgi:hypothetical protein